MTFDLLKPGIGRLRRIAECAAVSGDIRPLATDLKEEVEALMMMDDDYAVWGRPDGIGFAPAARMATYRDRLAAGGAQRVCRLGDAGPSTIGNPWDGMYPLHRFVSWAVHEDGVIDHSTTDDQVYVNP